jgi:hypothetical protein
VLEPHTAADFFLRRSRFFGAHIRYY